MNYEINNPERKQGFKLVRKLFLAEGPSEVGLLSQRLNALQADPEKVGIYCFKGINKLAPHTKTLVDVLDTELGNVDVLDGIGVLADAETDVGGRLTAVIDLLKALNFPRCAPDILKTGRHENGERRAAVSLSPSNSANGRIEDLILMEINQAPERECLSAFTACLEVLKGQPLDNKAQAQIFISTRIAKLCGVGRSFEANILNVSHEAYTQHRQMIDYVLGSN